jgi:hypothetical protein
MPFTDLADYLARRETHSRRQYASKNLGSTVGARLHGQWRAGPYQGAIPTVPEVPTSATPIGPLKDGNAQPIVPRTGERLVGVRGHSASGAASFANRASWALIDRLSHQGGLDGTSVATQTTNLPTAAITRGDTTGADVEAAIFIYTAIGVTTSAVVCAYTDPTGTPRTSPAVTLGGSGYNNVSRVIPIPCEQGAPRGFQSIESVTLSGSTGTVGNFGVFLYRRLFQMRPIFLNGEFFDWDPLFDNGGHIPEIDTDACLEWLIGTETSQTPYTDAEFLWLTE